MGLALLNLLFLVVAIFLEVCGDAAIRLGLRGPRGWFFVGAVLLVSYGCVVSLPSWTFSRTMGVYIALFFCRLAVGRRRDAP